MAEILKAEDYEEACCPLDLHPETVRIPVRRVIERLDEYLSRNDTAAAERHLQYWLSEAEAGNDLQGKLTVLNEQIGLYRKLGRAPEGLACIDAALALTQELGLDGTVSMGTTLINAATACKAFADAARALPLYQKARALYEALLEPDDERLGGLYNNMALTLLELGRFREAETLLEKALDIMSRQPDAQAEMAITCLNLADLAQAEFGREAAAERIGAYLQRAEELLDTPELPHDGHYAFVCEKCASVFGDYGWFLTQQELALRAREIYERA